MSDERLNQAPKTFDEVLAQSQRPRSAVFLLGFCAATVLLRFLLVPWDFGGFFLHVWVSLVGTSGYAGALWFLKGSLRVVTSSILFLLVPFMTVGTVFFAPQALFPFMFFGGALFAAFWFGSRSKTRYALMAFILLIPLGAYCAYGVRHMATLIRLRTLTSEDVQAVEFINAETKEAIVINAADPRWRIIGSLAATTPYSPNHEGIREPWELIIHLAHGSDIRCRVGNGNRTHPEAAWISFGEAVYQNAKLRLVLLTEAPNLWPVSPTQPPP